MSGLPVRLVSLAAAVAFVQLPALDPKPDVHVVVSVLAKRALERPVAGLSIAIARNGVVTESRGFGFADVETKTPVTPTTVFHIASISKNILAGAVLKLVEEGRLSLDADITTYVPDAPTHGRRVTLRHLLSHTSGLFSYTAVPDADANEALDLSHEQVLALVKDRPEQFAPGASWQYSNTGSYLAGMAIERVTGTTYAAFLRERIFTPLGMTSSSLCTARDTVPGLARGYAVRDGHLGAVTSAAWTVPFAGGGVCATAADLIRWQRALDGGWFLSRASVDLMRAATTLADGTPIDYGLGTRRGSLQGHAMVGHTGSGNGFTTVLETFPDDRLTIVVLANTEPARPTAIAAAIARSALELAPPPFTGSDVPADEMAALAGRFESEDGPIENYACGSEICFRPVGATQGQAAKRQAPFVYLVDADTEVRFRRPPLPVEWGFVYSGGLFSDAARRIR